MTRSSKNGTRLALVALVWASCGLSACDFATGAACESDENCPDQAPVCADISDGVGACRVEPIADAGAVPDAGPDDAGGDAGGDVDAGADDAGADTDAGPEADAGGPIDAGPGDAGGDAGFDGGVAPCLAGAGVDAGGPLLASAGFAFPISEVTTDEETLLVRGSAWDDVEVCSVTVNGVAGVYDFPTRQWTVDLPLSLGDNELVLVVTAPGDESITLTGTTVHRVDALPLEPRGGALIIGPGSERMFAAADNASGHVYGVRVSDGEIVYLSGARRGGGTPAASIDFPFSVASDPLSTDLFVINTISVIRVDAVTGDRTVVSSLTVGGGPVGSWQGIAVEAGGQRLFLHDPNAQLILAVDVFTGIRNVIASNTVGNGPALEAAAGFTWAAGKLYLATHTGGFEIIEIDPATGNRSVLSSAGVGVGLLPSGAGPITPDVGATPAGLLVMSQDGSLYAVEFASGDRSSLGDLSAAADYRGAVGMASDIDNIYVTDHNVPAFHIWNRAGQVASTYPNAAGSGARLDWPDQLMLDPTGTFLYVSDRQERVFRVVVDGGDRLVVSSDAFHNDGASYSSIDDLQLDHSGELLVVDQGGNAVWRIISGSRGGFATNSGFAFGDVGIGTAVNAPFALARGDSGHAMLQGGADGFVLIDGGLARSAVDVGVPIDPDADLTYSFAAGFYFATNPTAGTVLKIDGTATVFSAAGVGMGNAFNNPLAIAGSTEGLWVLNEQPQSIVEVDVDTGDRTVVTADYEAFGPTFSGAQSMHVEGTTAWVTSLGRNAVMVVDLVTGERAIVSQ